MRREPVRISVGGAELDAVCAAGGWEPPPCRLDSAPPSAHAAGSPPAAPAAAAVAGARARGWIGPDGRVRAATAGLCDVLCRPHAVVCIDVAGTPRRHVMLGAAVAVAASPRPGDVDVVDLCVADAADLDGLIRQASGGDVRGPGLDASGDHALRPALDVVIVRPGPDGVIEGGREHLGADTSPAEFTRRLAVWCAIARGEEDAETGSCGAGGANLAKPASHAAAAPVVVGDSPPETEPR